MAQTITVDLQYKPRPWQNRFHRNRKRYNVLKVHRRGGKTLAAVMELIDSALKCEKPMGRFGYVGPTLVQAKAIAWEYIKSKSRLVPGTKINESECWVEFQNGSRIRVFGTDYPDSLRGLYFDGVVLDEVALMKSEIWGEIIRPAIADRQGWIIFMGTPKGISLLSEMYNKAVAAPEEWFAAAFNINDTGANKPRVEQPDTECLCLEEVEEMRKDMTESQFAQEMMCDDNAGNENSLLSLNLVEAAFGRYIEPIDYDFAPLIIGCDVARGGNDKTTIWKRQGKLAQLLAVYNNYDTMETAAAVSQFAREYKAKSINVDAGGVGGGVVDRLRQMGWTNVQDINFAGSPADQKYKNKRAEMHFKAAQWVKEGGCIKCLPDYVQRLKIEMCAPQYHHRNPKGQLQIESKDDIKERIGFSPDLFDGLCSTFAVEVYMPTVGEQMSERAISRRNNEYNPFYDIESRDQGDRRPRDYTAF